MTKQSIQPLNDFVFLSWEKQKETDKGIILSDTSKSNPAIAIVIAVGPGKMDKNGNFIKITLKPKDKVIVDPFIPQPVKIMGEEFWVVRESEIFGKLN